jgi:hypothetical protein
MKQNKVNNQTIYSNEKKAIMVGSQDIYGNDEESN